MKKVQSQDLVDRVEAKIRALFREGLPITPDVVQYIEATLGSADPYIVADLLDRPGESDCDSLLELVFFPDADFQCALETVLMGGGLGDGDQSRLAERLKDGPAWARLVYPSCPRLLGCRLPRAGVAPFLARLRLGWSIEGRLREALDQWSARQGEADTDLDLLTVKLRNAGLQQTPGQVGLLLDFLERMPPDDRRWAACFDFLLAFLPENEHESNLYRALMNRKIFLVRHLIKARRNAETLARSNMETLSLGGFRAAHFDTVAAEGTLGCIDAVALAVYGRTEHFDEAPLSMDLGEMGAADLEGVVRRLL